MWNGVPLYPNTVLFKESSTESVLYTTTDSVAVVEAWYRREWPRAGLVYVTEYNSDRLNFHLYTRGGVIFGYAVQEAAPGVIGVSMIRTKT